MRIVIIKAGQPPLIKRALDHLIKGLMLDRANRSVMEDREAATEAVDQAVDLKRIIGEIQDHEGACLVIGGGGSFPGFMQIDRACEELFGPDGTPAILRDAVSAHAATLATAVAGAAYVGVKMDATFKAARDLLEELGEGSAVDVKAETEALREALDQAEACADARTVNQEGMDEAVANLRRWMPGLASWVATIRSLDRDPDVEAVIAAARKVEERFCVYPEDQWPQAPREALADLQQALRAIPAPAQPIEERGDA